MKGNAFENVCCKIFAEVFGGSWKKVFGSGAYVGRSNAYRRADMSAGQLSSTKADIHTPDEFPKLVIEAKSYQDFSFHLLLKESVLLDNWLQEIFECIDEGDFWLLVMKFNRKGTFVATKFEFGDFKLDNHFIYNSSRFGKLFFTGDVKSFLENNKELIIKLSK